MCFATRIGTRRASRLIPSLWSYIEVTSLILTNQLPTTPSRTTVVAADGPNQEATSMLGVVITVTAGYTTKQHANDDDMGDKRYCALHAHRTLADTQRRRGLRSGGESLPAPGVTHRSMRAAVNTDVRARAGALLVRRGIVRAPRPSPRVGAHNSGAPLRGGCGAPRARERASRVLSRARDASTCRVHSWLV